MPEISVIQAMDDPQLFGRWFRNPASWATWRVFLKGLFGLPMSGPEAEVFAQIAGGRRPPTEPAREAWLVIGRRGGKSFITALVGVYLACFRDYTPHLAPGERATVMLIAADRKQARVLFRYVRALITETPMLAKLVVAETSDGLELANRVNIEIHTASFRAVRGYTVAAALLDEIAFWRSDDSANPDREIVAAIRPALTTIPNALLIGLSSPYARRGVLWDMYNRHYGRDSDVLVVQAHSRTMNPSLPQSVVDRAYADDPVSAAAEYGAVFRPDVEGFLRAEWIAVAHRHELPPVFGTSYFAFVDPSGGGADAFTLAIAHREGEAVVVDLCRGRRPPFSPESVVEDYAALLKRYGCYKVTGDRYGGDWPAEAFRRHGITYEPAQKPKSDLYLEVEPLFAQGRVRLPDVPELVRELQQLERRTGAGRDRVDHPPRGHDDYANAAAGALWLAGKQRQSIKADDFFAAEDERLEVYFAGLAEGAADYPSPWQFH